MKKYLRLGVLLLLVSCGGHTPPRNLDDACALTDERPSYLNAMQDAERRWGVPVHVQMATIYQESKFVGNAKTPRKFFLGFIPAGRQTSAYGYSQAIDGAWEDYRQATGNFGARRTSIEDATDFIGWYMDQASQQLGISKYDAGNQYLAYHEGIAGYQRGNHNDKAWLLRVSSGVSSRADRYQRQLIACGKL
ncbi:MAG: lytic transglycosylase [Proteobacteria bacterium]|nr:lytic transglycosylase [Pseudomonadota bacterium]MBS0574709.1 lytic transglycosylase [Pseudomonadota bacterium]